MATYWNGGSGQWQVTANWSDGAPTTPQSFAVIQAPGNYTVSISRGLEYIVGAITLNGAHAILAIAGILDLKNKLLVSKGTLKIGGTIDGGSIVAAGGRIAFLNGTLDGVKFLGPLNLSTGKVTVKDGLTLRNIAGTGPGAFTLSGAGQITFAGDQTIDGGIWTITGGTVAQTGTLTLGASEDVEYKAAKSAFAAKASLVSKGKFDIGKGASLSAGQVVNSGKMTVNGGGVFSAVTFTNSSAGSVAIHSGSVFKSDSFNNVGTFSADSSTVSLIEAAGGSFGNLAITNSAIQLGIITSIAELNTLETTLSGHGNSLMAEISINNTGNAITVNTPSGFTAFACGGTITGGTVMMDTSFSGTLSNLTLEGTLNAEGNLSFDNVTFTGAGGTGVGAINLGGNLVVQYPPSSASLDNVLIIGDAHTNIDAYLKSLTLGSNLTVEAMGEFGIGERSRLRRLVNNGTLEADGGAKTTFFLLENRIINNGTFRVENGGAFRIRPRNSFANLSGAGATATLTGGIYDIGAHSTMELEKSAIYVTILQANVALEGAGASFLSDGLATIGVQGVLSLQNGATLGVASNFTVDGTLDLAASNFTATNITLNAGGTVNGHGAVLGAVANAGTIDASGGTLSVSQSVTGAGTAEIENNATLSFGANVSTGQTVTFEGAAGTLALGNAGGFAGTVAGFAPGNSIDLINTMATAVTYNAGADTLTVENDGTVIAALQLSGTYTGDTFGLASDGKGGTEVTVATALPAVHRFIEAVVAFSRSHMAFTGLSVAPDSNQISPALTTSHFNHG